MFIEIKPMLDFAALEPGKAATDAIRKAAVDLDIAGKYRRPRPPDRAGADRQRRVRHRAGRRDRSTASVTVLIVLVDPVAGAAFGQDHLRGVRQCSSSGLSITTAVGLMLVGSFNLISIAFAVLFVGLGVDFGIQYSVRYRSERFKNDDLEQALARAAEALGGAAVAGGDGDGGGLPVVLADRLRRASRELGKIAGVGMMIAFFGSITVLPALLKLLNPPGEKEPVGYAFLAPVDHFLEKHRIAVIGGTLLVALAGLPLLYYPALRLQPDEPAQSESRIDRDLSRSAQRSEHRHQRHQRAGQNRKPTRSRSRISSPRCRRSAARCRSTVSCPPISRRSSR